MLSFFASCLALCSDATRCGPSVLTFLDEREGLTDDVPRTEVEVGVVVLASSPIAPLVCLYVNWSTCEMQSEFQVPNSRKGKVEAMDGF